MASPGTVHLVGAGPGDPGLITRRAHELIAACDCLVYDYLVHPRLVDLAPPQAVRFFVGKKGGTHAVTQTDINALLVEQAKLHRSVVRLKGGDPFVFGRGGEEAQALRAAGIGFTVVPGITAGIAAPAYAGIPVTHRDATSAVVFITGHEQPGAEPGHSRLDWAALAKIGTVVSYMGVKHAGLIAERLISAGRSADTPCAAISWGTWPRQRVLRCTLADLGQRVAATALPAPAIIVVGQVAAFADTLAWFQPGPLAGKTVLVTRAEDQASELVGLLEAHGARVLTLATLRCEAPANTAPLDRAIANLGAYAWVAFTSANGARMFCQRLWAAGRDARALAGCKLAGVGPSVERALAHYGLRCDCLPSTFDAAHLAEAITAAHGSTTAAGGKVRVLLPQADNARSTLNDKLRAAGFAVEPVTAYRSVSLHPELADDGEPIHAITLASSATVERLVAAVGPTVLERLLRQGCRFHCIGEQTAATCRSLGLPVHGIASTASIAALAESVLADLGRQPG